MCEASRSAVSDFLCPLVRTKPKLREKAVYD